MKTKKIPIFLILITVIFYYESIVYSYKFNEKKPIINPSKKHLTIGEEFLYQIELFGIPVGWVNLKIKEKLLVNDRMCYHIYAYAYANRFFRKFYNIHYTVESYIDQETLLPSKFYKQKKIKEKTIETNIDFDWNRNEAIFCQKMPNEIETSIIPLSNKMQDILSSLYYFRLMDIDSNNNYNLNIFYNKKIWNINIKIKSPQIIDIYKLGSFDTFETEITTELSQIILGTPYINVYFTNDNRRIPILFYINLPLLRLRGRVCNLQ